MRVIAAIALLSMSVFFLSTHSSDKAILDESVDRRESTILYSLMGIIDYLHFKPKKVNDSFSKEVVKDYLENIDGAKRFLIQEEVDLLLQYNKEIDDEIDRFSFNFFDISVDLMDKSIDRAEQLYKSVMQDDFDLNVNERFEMEGKKKAYAQSEEELEDEWRKFLKYNILSKMESYIDDEKMQDLTEAEKYSKAKESVQKLFDDWFKRLQKSRRADRFDDYINTILTQYDPHSYYFSPKEKENFDIKMGNKLEGIGAQLQQADDYVRVYSIVPGGPAWKKGELEVDDLIVAVTQDGEETVDITGMRLDDVIRMIRGDKGTVVNLRLKKKDGTYENISILRDEIILDDAAAKSAILESEANDEKIGYIHLPLFYSTFDDGNSCSKDIEEELEKLNEENVDGVILDLRYNGGGSLPDVISMAGLFIEEGPILQVKGRDKKPQVHSDEDRSVTYDGPLIVLVNEVSASSSEILVGALQDYGRAVIVGGERTFGKATVQGLYDLDRMISKEDEIKPLGQVKLTTQKFYRIDGTSNQLDGVIPDVIIPDQFSFTEYGEQELEGALSNSKIAPLEYSQNVYKVKNLDVLQKKSTERLAQDPNFKKVNSYGNLLTNLDKETSVSLSFEQFIEDREVREKMLEPYNDLFEDDVDGFTVRNIEADMEYINQEESRKDKNQNFIEGLQKDFYLLETLSIMHDMLSMDKGIANK